MSRSNVGRQQCFTLVRWISENGRLVWYYRRTDDNNEAFHGRLRTVGVWFVSLERQRWPEYINATCRLVALSLEIQYCDRTGADVYLPHGMWRNMLADMYNLTYYTFSCRFSRSIQTCSSIRRLACPLTTHIQYEQPANWWNSEQHSCHAPILPWMLCQWSVVTISYSDFDKTKYCNS